MKFLTLENGTVSAKTIGDIVLLSAFFTPESFKQESDIDDTDALQKAVDYSEQYKVPVFLKGKYTTRRTVMYGSNVQIIGFKSQIEITNDKIGAVLGSKSFDLSWFQQYGSTQNVSISGIEFIVPENAEVAGIGINRGYNIDVFACISRNMKSHLVDITGKNIRVKNCIAYGSINPNAPYQVDNLEVNNGQPQWKTDENGFSVAITCDGFQSEDVVIEDNYAFDCFHAVHLHRQNDGKKSYVTVKNNRFFNCEIPVYCDPNKTWNNIDIEANIFHSDVPRFQAILANGIWKNVNVKNNKFYNYMNVFLQSTTGASWDGGSFVDNTCIAESSALAQSDRRAINIQRTVKNVSFYGNTFEGFDRGINSNSTALVENIKIINNEFRNIKERAVGLDKATDCSVKLNKIKSVNKAYDVGTFSSTSWRTYSSDYGIAGVIVNESKNIVIESNTFTDLNCVCLGINSINAKDITVKDNTCKNVVALITTISSTTSKMEGLKISDNKINKTDWDNTFGAGYITSVKDLEILNNSARGIMFNGWDVRDSIDISTNENLIKGGFSSGIDKKAFVFTNCEGVKYKNNSSTLYDSGNYELFVSACKDSEFYCTKSIGFANNDNTLNCRFFYNSNNVPTGSQVGKYAVGSIITNDNNTGGNPTGEPVGWVCTVEANASTFLPFGQLGLRTISGNPNANGVVAWRVGEEIYDSTYNRFFKATSTSPPTSSINTWVISSQEQVTANVPFNPPAILSKDFYSEDFTVQGVVQGMFVQLSLTGNTGNLIINGKVIGDNLIRVVVFNPNNSTIDYGDATLVIKATK